MLDEKVIQMIAEGIRDTLYMTLLSTIIGYVIGLPFGILLHVTSEKGLHPNRIIYRIGDFICNIIRSIPFLILLILLIPFTRLIVGKSYGSTATIVPLVICAAPYIARVVESSLNEVDAGVIEAAKAVARSTSVFFPTKTHLVMWMITVIIRDMMFTLQTGSEKILG